MELCWLYSLPCIEKNLLLQAKWNGGIFYLCICAILKTTVKHIFFSFHSKRQEPYSSSDQKIFAEIIKEVDPSGLVLFSAKKDAGTSKQKAAWVLYRNN